MNRKYLKFRGIRVHPCFSTVCHVQSSFLCSVVQVISSLLVFALFPFSSCHCSIKLRNLITPLISSNISLIIANHDSKHRSYRKKTNTCYSNLLVKGCGILKLRKVVPCFSHKLDIICINTI